MSGLSFTYAADVVEHLREAYSRHPAHNLYAEAADLIETLADRVNHLTNINDGKSETIAEMRAGLAELKAMLTEKSA